MTPEIRSIVVGVESVHEPDPFLPAALELAARLGATVHVAHGYMLTDPLLDAYARAGYLNEEMLVNFGRDLQACLERQVRALTDRPDVHPQAVAGPASAALLELCEDVKADLVILGATRHGRFPLSLLGSTLRSVLRRSTAPVLMMRPEISPVPRKLLLPTDLSPVSAAVSDWGAGLARAAGVDPEMRVLLVIRQSLMMLPLEQQLLDEVAENEVAELTRRLRESYGKVEKVVRHGEPAAEIIEEARNWQADLVVVGTHGRKGMERLLLGSVAEATVRGAPCNVLVVPPAAVGGDETEGAPA